MLSRIQGKAVININDHPEIRRVFAAFPIKETELRYTVGGGGGVGRGELLIFSWDIDREPAGLF